MKKTYKKILLFIALAVIIVFSLLQIWQKIIFSRVDNKDYDINGYLKDQENLLKSGLEPEYDTSKILPANILDLISEGNNILKSNSKGRIIIPSVGIDLGVYEGINDAHLYLGLGEQLPREEQTMGHRGNYILCGHNFRNMYTPLLEPIKDLKKGDFIYLLDKNNLYMYKVFFSSRVSVEDTSYLDYTDKAITTIYTCIGWPYLKDERRLVQAELFKSISLNEIREKNLESKIKYK